MARQQPEDEKRAGRRRAVPRDMQDQQARTPPEQGRAGREETKGTRDAAERTDAAEPQEDEPPD
ncbi:hypothetical protein GO001_19345 [Streptomyces sp. NRRL B-1677]|nr:MULTISPECIES: hypothetical protein [Streptomyces]MBF6047364.1 hypothetical protein [Streptomyces sp. NRRL B-1677]